MCLQLGVHPVIHLQLVSSEDAFDDHEKHTRSIGLLLSRPLVGCILYQTIETEHMEKWEAMGECDAK